MDLFGLLAKGSGATDQPEQDKPKSERQPTARDLRTASRRQSIYSVRVHEEFKSMMLRLQAELQLERHKLLGKCARVTEGEVAELMLENFVAAREQGKVSGLAVALSNEVWQGIHTIARHRRIAPSQVVEELVVREIGDLGLIPKKQDQQR